MILVKRKYLYILTFLFSLLLIFGEVKFFFALRSANLTSNLDVKYQAENFIFASIVLFLILYLFLFDFIRKSSNILRKLDKIIGLSEYGTRDISGHLKDLGILGEKVRYLLYHLNQLNEMKSLKISSLSGINSFLMSKVEEKIFILDYNGDIIDCGPRFPEMIGEKKEGVLNSNINDFYRDLSPGELYSDIEKTRSPIEKTDVALTIGKKEERQNITFYPVFNANNQISHLIGLVN